MHKSERNNGEAITNSKIKFPLQKRLVFVPPPKINWCDDCHVALTQKNFFQRPTVIDFDGAFETQTLLPSP
jgi:hypothetical protein